MSKLYHTIYYILIKIVSYIVVVLSGRPPHSQKKKGKKKKVDALLFIYLVYIFLFLFRSFGVLYK